MGLQAVEIQLLKSNFYEQLHTLGGISHPPIGIMDGVTDFGVLELLPKLGGDVTVSQRCPICSTENVEQITVVRLRLLGPAVQQVLNQSQKYRR